MTFEEPNKSNKEKDSEESKKISEEEVDDEKEMLMGLKALERIKKMKGKDLSPFMQGQKEYAEKKLGEEDIKNMESSEEVKELSEALDRLEQIKELKKIKKEKSEEKQEAEKTKTCAKCGAENPIGDNFCRKCGNKYEEIKKEDAGGSELTEKEEIETLNSLKVLERVKKAKGKDLPEHFKKIKDDLEKKHGDKWNEASEELKKLDEKVANIEELEKAKKAEDRQKIEEIMKKIKQM